VVDTSPGIGNGVADFLVDADKVLLVTTPEPTSLQDAYAALKTITQQMPEKSVLPVVTCATQTQAHIAVKALNQVAQKFLGIECSEWYHVEADALISRTISNRKPLISTHPQSPAARCMRQLANSLFGNILHSDNIVVGSKVNRSSTFVGRYSSG
jgi:flagellar biosynthesis protein FlhG